MLNATLNYKQEVDENLLIIKVKPDTPIPFKPGQYIALGLFGSSPRKEGYPPDPEKVLPDKLIKRSYSIASSPEENTLLEFYIAIVREGIFSPRLAALKEGERLHIGRRAVGTFTLEDVPADAPLLLIATGTGVAPYISMLRYSKTWDRKAPITLLHGVRYPNHLAYHKELQELAKARENFSYYPIVSRGNSEWKGHKGHIQDLFKNGVITPLPEHHIFLCGNPSMVEDLTKYFTAKGFKVHKKREPGNLHLEKYW
ncbi:MAG: ferredoxin--NADP reductase [Candidatus Dadabacteria bacterium]|nr:MAG: ferredoxin--NADP reductase [Candidatus Dadabacteria bacterium]